MNFVAVKDQFLMQLPCFVITIARLLIVLENTRGNYL